MIFPENNDNKRICGYKMVVGGGGGGHPDLPIVLFATELHPALHSVAQVEVEFWLDIFLQAFLSIFLFN